MCALINACCDEILGAVLCDWVVMFMIFGCVYRAATPQRGGAPYQNSREKSCDTNGSLDSRVQVSKTNGPHEQYRHMLCTMSTSNQVRLQV